MVSHKKLIALLVAALAGAIVLPVFAQDGGSRREKMQQRMKKILERFPEADTDKDGKLSREEFKAFRNKRREGRTPKTAASHKDVKYGTHERHVLDLYLVKSEKPTPLAIYIHGGGFVGGSKGSLSGKLLAEFHKNGISVASIHYRLVTQAIFPACFNDGARAVQFLRHNAKTYNLDKTRFGAYGGSAGAGISMWLGYHDDLRNPESEDPIARQSTRLKVVGSIAGQTSYDPNVIKAWIGGRAWEHPSIAKIYGKKAHSELTQPDEALQKLYDECSAIKHLTKDDPPTFLSYKEADKDLPEGSRPGQGIHHPKFAHKLRAKCKELKIETAYRHKDDGKEEDVNVQLVAFFVKHFKMEKAAKPEETDPGSEGDGGMGG